MESFFASLKTEWVHEARFRTRAEARAAVFEYIEVFYNRQESTTPRFTRYSDPDLYEEHGVKSCRAREPQEPVRARIGRH